MMVFGANNVKPKAAFYNHAALIEWCMPVSVMRILLITILNYPPDQLFDELIHIQVGCPYKSVRYDFRKCLGWFLDAHALL